LELWAKWVKRSLNLLAKYSIFWTSNDHLKDLRVESTGRRQHDTPGVINAAVDYRNKSRLEEINEIIARSQVRAQQLLAAGSLNSPTVVIATTTSSAPLVAVAGQQQTLALSTTVEHSTTSTRQLMNHDLCHVTSGDNAAVTDAASNS